MLWLVAACGDDDDAEREEACRNERELSEQIASKATQDGISSEGLCNASAAEIANRLAGSRVWGKARDLERAERADQYFGNCQKLRDAKAACND
jgi:hypothetical protein